MPESIADEPYRAPVITGETVFEGTVWNINRDRFAFGGGELPAGLLDIAGEPPLDAAKRELAEEAEIDMRWMPLSEVVAAVLDGRLRNSILAIAVLNAHARR